MATTADRPVFIQHRDSGLYLEYQPNSAFDVVVNPKKDGNLFQKWELTSSGVEGYLYITNMGESLVVSAPSKEKDPLFMSTKTSDLNKSQLWILREPNSGTNAYFVLMNATTGMVMKTINSKKDPGTVIQIIDRDNDKDQQWSFSS